MRACMDTRRHEPTDFRCFPGNSNSTFVCVTPPSHFSVVRRTSNASPRFVVFPPVSTAPELGVHDDSVLLSKIVVLDGGVVHKVVYVHSSKFVDARTRQERARGVGGWQEI